MHRSNFWLESFARQSSYQLRDHPLLPHDSHLRYRVDTGMVGEQLSEYTTTGVHG
jgi:hypothetical protein